MSDWTGPTPDPEPERAAEPELKPAPGRVTVRYWAAARAAAGVEADEVPAATLAEAVAAVSALRGAGLARVLAACSYLVDSAPAGRRPPEEVALPPGAVVEALPPFAGG